MMKKTKLAAVIAAFVSPVLLAATSLSVDEASVVSATGGIVAESLNNKDQQYTDGAYQVKPGVWSLTGLGMDNVNVIEGDTGLIVIDGGISRDYAKKAISLLPPEIAQKPVTGVVYTHWHYIMGMGEWNVNEDTVVIAHKNHQRELETATDTSSPTGPARVMRGAIQLGSFLPKEGEDSPSVTGLVNIDFSDISGYVPPNKLVDDADTDFEIDGIRITTSGAHSDTMDGLSIYLPDQKISIDNTYWAHGLFNFSTLRGDRWRDTEMLAKATQWLLDKDIDYSLKVHGKPVTGEVFKEQLTAQMRSIDLLISETEKAIGQGMSMDEIQYSVTFPQELADSPYVEQNYGEWTYHTRRYYSQAMHWFGNDSIDLHPLERNDEAQRMVKAMGGIDTVIANAKEAFKAGEYQWSAQQATYAIRSGSKEAKQVKADALRKMAQKATASNTRNWMLTHAMVLEGKLDLPIVLTGEY
ncbi:MAG: alkyl sulfatase dimerization domain-containing protein [Endozoicomonas sp.]